MSSARFSPIFTDHAVLQRGKNIKLWGSCRPDSALHILLTEEDGLSDSSPCRLCISPETFPDGHFYAELPAQKEGGPYRLILRENGETVQLLRDIMIGEVWLAGGQSNMEYELQNDKDASDSLQCPPSLDVRFYQVLRQSWFHENFNREEQTNRWMLPTDPKFGTWSAVAFHFAAELSGALNCCVGIIGCNWGGTSASAWQDRESLLSHSETAIYWEEYADLIDRQSPEEYEKSREEYFRYQEGWQPKIDEFYRENPEGSWEDALIYAGPCRWPGPMGPKHEFRPCGLYETMLRRVTPYTIQGFLYYQGESDDHRPTAYYTLLKSMLQTWRRDFGDMSLYFLNVQLPMHRYANEEVSDSWAVIREAQMRLYREDPLSGLAVCIDCGEFNNIHPTHKKEVGHRLFLQSMSHVYHILKPADAHGPILKRVCFFRASRTVLLEFDCADAGFDRERYDAVVNGPHNADRTALVGFEAAGSDGIFYPASADFRTGEHCITLNLPPKAGVPVCVRYLWANYSLVPLFDTKGMPAAPFRCKPEIC